MYYGNYLVLLPEARPYGIVGHYSFDMMQAVDSSGHKNHALGNIVPSTSIHGSSALFRKNYILIPHSAVHETTDYSVTFWLYRLEDEESKTAIASSKPLESWCPGRLHSILSNYFK